jgi:hypothetical protein
MDPEQESPGRMVEEESRDRWWQVCRLEARMLTVLD